MTEGSQPVEEAVPQVIAREWFEKGWRGAMQWLDDADPSDYDRALDVAYLAACRLLRHEHEQKV